MCLLVIANNFHPKYKYIIVGNRDEFYNRDALSAHFWETNPNILAGKDLIAGGTWLGITKQGRITALSNYRDPNHKLNDAISRGALTSNYLNDGSNPLLYLMRLQLHATRYNGFNLLCGDTNDLFYYSNFEMVIKKVNAGLFGLSNHLFDTPWPKVVLAKAMINAYLMTNDTINPSAVLDLMQDKGEADEEILPFTGIPLEWEKKLSPIFIETDNYGTCSSTVILWDHQDHITFAERLYNTKDGAIKEQNFEFDIEH